MNRTEINRVVQWCRSNFRNDGAEGESVHALCNYIDKLHARRFPILSDETRPGPRSIPWDYVEPHYQRAIANHDQTLERLAERGGLAYCELAAIVQNRKYRQMTDEEVAAFVVTIPE